MSTNADMVNGAIGVFHGNVHEAGTPHLKALFAEQGDDAFLRRNQLIVDEIGAERPVGGTGGRVLDDAHGRGKHTTMDGCLWRLRLLGEGQNLGGCEVGKSLLPEALLERDAPYGLQILDGNQQKWNATGNNLDWKIGAQFC